MKRYRLISLPAFSIIWIIGINTNTNGKEFRGWKMNFTKKNKDYGNI